MADGTIKVASCQFAVGSDVGVNAEHVRRFIAEAADGGADVVHFPECALSGYAGIDHPNLEGFDWENLREETRSIMEVAAANKIRVVLGSMHELSPPNKPFNSLYLIGDDGQIQGRYDKRFCTDMDFDHYSSGDRFVVFEINGVKCALLICFDLRFPEVYRAIYKLGVQCVFQSFYNARQQGPSVHTDIMRQTMQCRAATNYMWVSMTNSSGWFCPYPSCFIRPDGRIVEQLEDHSVAMMINNVDVSEEYYDPSRRYRDMVIEGKLTNGQGAMDDPRAMDVTSL